MIPERVYQVQYLLASKGKGIASSFGHSMIRLVICAPEHYEPTIGLNVPATPFGPSCLKDTNYHLVISFRANVDDIKVSKIKGITGKYPSILFMLPLEKIKEKYNKNELRDLYAFPVNFSEEEKRAFITQVLSLHWGYTGRYKFLSNNCSTETLNILLSIFKKTDYYIKNAKTPYGVLKLLQELELVDKKYTKKNNFSNLEKMNIMKSNIFYLVKALNVFYPSLKKIKKKHVLKYLNLPANDRREILQEISSAYDDLEANKKSDLDKKIASFLVLEDQAYSIYNKKRKDKVFSIVTKLAKKGKLDFKIDDFIEQFTLTHQTYFSSSYGIPLEQELDNLEIDSAIINEKTKENYDQALLILKPYMEKYDIELEKINQNIKQTRDLFVRSQ